MVHYIPFLGFTYIYNSNPEETLKGFWKGSCCLMGDTG